MHRAVPILILLPLGVTAQHREVLLKNWSAPLNWQPTIAEAEAGAITLSAQAPSSSPLVFMAMTPCRVVDTRAIQNFPSPFGAPSLAANTSRTFPIQSSTLCAIPASAQAYSFNVTVVPPGPLGYLTIWPSGQTQPNAVTLDDVPGDIRNNAAIVPAGTPNGSVDVHVNGNTDVVIDINGYYYAAPASGATGNANLAFNLNPGTAGSPIFPHPFESDQGWGGGSQPQELVNGFRGCNNPGGWPCGLAFTGGDANWGGQACGVRQATIDLGSTSQVSAVAITHHSLTHVPTAYQIQTWNGSSWVTQASITNNIAARCLPNPSFNPTVSQFDSSWNCVLVDEFPPVQTSKVRYTFNNCPNVNPPVQGGSAYHGWLWEFEVYRLPL